MIKKLRLLILSLLLLLILSPVSFAANSFGSGGTGVTGNTIVSDGTIPDNILDQNVPTSTAATNTTTNTLRSLINSATTKVWYMDTSINSDANGAPNFNITSSGTYWLILNPGASGVTYTINSGNYINLAPTNGNATLNIYVAPTSATASILSTTQSLPALCSGATGGNQSTVNIYGGGANQSKLIISSTFASNPYGAVYLRDNSANTNQFNIRSTNVSIASGTGSNNGAVYADSGITTDPNITDSIVRVSTGAAAKPAFGGSATFNPNINNSVVCCTTGSGYNSTGSPFGNSPSTVNDSLVISSTQSLGATTTSSSIIEQLPATGNSVLFNDSTNVFNATNVRLTGSATVIGPSSANLTAGINGPTVDWGAPFNNLILENAPNSGNSYALSIPNITSGAGAITTLNIPQDSSVTVLAPSRTNIAGNVNDIGDFNYYYFDGQYGDVFSVSMNGNAPTFYNTTSNVAPTYQSSNVELSTTSNLKSEEWNVNNSTSYQNIANLNTNNVYPWNLNWTLGNFDSSSTTDTNITAGSTQAQLALSNESSFNTNWTLINAGTSDAVNINGVSVSGFSTAATGHNGVRLFSPLDENGDPTTEVYLLYNGYGANSGNKLNPGIYTLTAQFPQASSDFDLNGAQVNPSFTLNFNVENSNVASVSILNANNETFNNPLTIDLNNGRTYQLNYVARNSRGDVVPANDANWELAPTLSNGVATSNYAVINANTGLITFIQPLPQNVYMTVNLTVDGVQANPSAIVRTTGSLPVQEITGIAPIVDPITVYSGNAFYPISNLEFTPLNNPVTSNVTFTSSNSAILVRPATTTNGGLSLIAPSPTYTGSTTVTATYTEGTNTYTTSYVVNFSPTPIGIDGVTAEEQLDFVLTAPTVQNVSAKYNPENATVNSISDYAQTVNGTTNVKNLLNLFTYNSSNPSVATVDSYGNVTPIAVGTTTVTTTYSVPDTNTRYTATTTINVLEAPIIATSISLDKTVIYLAPEGTADGTMSADLTATVVPDNVDPSSVTWTVDSEDITLSETTGLTTTVTSTDATGSYTVTASVPGADETALTATATVIVSEDPIVIDPTKTSITATSPDFYTVTVAPTVNTAISGASDEDIAKVAIFTWSQIDQTDIDCKVATDNGDGTWSYEFPVNNTPVNEYYIDASDIIVQAYASTDPNENGNMVWNTTWNYADCGWTDGVIATPYVQNQGFITPSVGNGALAGTTGKNTQMEGIRLSTDIEGVDVVYDVHAQNIGWMDQVNEGVYAGTMHQNLQIEAIHIKLTGANASQYTVQYQAHVENLGWMDWVADGAEAGTTGQGLQLEGLRIQIVPAGTALPSNNA